jgi:hypothetical protein
MLIVRWTGAQDDCIGGIISFIDGNFRLPYIRPFPSAICIQYPRAALRAESGLRRRRCGNRLAGRVGLSVVQPVVGTLHARFRRHFLILHPQTGADQARARLEDIGCRIASQTFQAGGRSVWLIAAIGVPAVVEEEGEIRIRGSRFAARLILSTLFSMEFENVVLRIAHLNEGMPGRHWKVTPRREARRPRMRSLQCTSSRR